MTFKEKPKTCTPYGYTVEYSTTTKEEVKAMQDEFARYEPARWRDGAAIYSHGLIVEPTFQGVITKDKWTRINERSRTYYFANGVTTSVDRPTWLWPSSSGTHYIKDSYGKIHVINKSWVRITITE